MQLLIHWIRDSLCDYNRIYMDKKNILLISGFYPPEIRSGSHLIYELAQELHAQGNNIKVVTSYPQYNLIPEQRKRHFSRILNEEGIEVIRVKTLPHHKVNYFIRGIAEITLPFLYFFSVLRYIRTSIDIVIVYSPPLPLGITGMLVKKFYKSKFILNVQDIFPQNAIDLGVISNKFVISFFEHIEKNVYNSADYIINHSHGNKKFLIEKKRVPILKAKVVYNWIDVDSYTRCESLITYRKLYGLENKFIFLFAGVTGPSQGLDFLLKIAYNVRDISDIFFLIVGDGTELERLKKIVQAQELTNVGFQSFVSREEYPKLVKEVDVGLVCLSSKNKTPVVPGKILGYMAAAKPVIALLHQESDGHVLIQEAQCGYSALSNDEQNSTSIIRKIYSERKHLLQYGTRGFEYVLHNFDIKKCVQDLNKLF